MKPEIDLKNYESGFARFDSLMQHRVKDILLISSLYDSFLLEEDGQLAQMVFNEYVELNLSYAPHIKRVSNGRDALSMMTTRKYDLIIIVRRLIDMDLAEFSREARQITPMVPVVLLAIQPQEYHAYDKNELRQWIDRVFLWGGEVRVFPAIVKCLEDSWNVDSDTSLVGVRVIILIEDSVHFYSAYLPLIYTELMRQTQALMDDGINPAHRLLRMRARPKILVADNYEDAMGLFEKYRNFLLGIISDIKFAREGEVDSQAGLKFALMAKQAVPDLPVLLQSSNLGNAEVAAHNKLAFLHKRSPTLLNDLRHFIKQNFGFGDFVFRSPDGREIARASDFSSMEICLETVDEGSIVYHAGRNHFSNWLMARTEFDLANRLRPRKVSEFKDAGGLRRYLIDVFRNFRREEQRGVVIDFSRRKFDGNAEFVRIGEGSLGGKGRGLAFINSLLNRYNITDSFEGVRISVPSSAILGTSVFDRFLEQNHLAPLALGARSDEEIAAAFAQGSIPEQISSDLEAYLDVVDYPLVVRSSSLLEDSHYQPFAGIFDSHMLPNNHHHRKERLKRLEAAVKFIYATIFFGNSKSYIEATGNRVEEEKMAVIIQRAAGSQRGNHFYPVISGIARSYNYYSIGQIKPEEGVAYVALGLGKTVVEGGNCLYFSPSNPQRLPQFSTPKDFLKNSQSDFFAIDLSDPSVYPRPGGDAGLVKLGIQQAEADGTIGLVGSTYSSDDDRVHDGISRAGVRVVTFSPILKSKIFPLDEIIRFLLHLGSNAMNCPVEIEFAAEIRPQRNELSDFCFLQIRPMTNENELGDVNLEGVAGSRVVCRSEQSLSNGCINTIQDIVYVLPEKFDRARMHDIAEQVGLFNQLFKMQKRPYLLIGPGRWGTSDRWLGIPVSWNQISAARVIVEAAYGDFSVTPSFGTHFFQNLISSHIGYLTVGQPNDNSYIDWKWLTEQPVAGESEYIRHLSLPKPIEVRIDGRIGRAVILKP